MSLKVENCFLLLSSLTLLRPRSRSIIHVNVKSEYNRIIIGHESGTAVWYTIYKKKKMKNNAYKHTLNINTNFSIAHLSLVRFFVPIWQFWWMTVICLIWHSINTPNKYSQSRLLVENNFSPYFLFLCDLFFIHVYFSFGLFV